MMCADLGHLDDEIRALEQAGVDYFHVDIMDGAFVPNFGMGRQDAEYIAKRAKKPSDVHLMIQDPGAYAAQFAEMGASIIYIHPEADVHAARTLQKIIDAGAKPGIALNPGTAFETVKPLLLLAEYVLIMTVNPGYAGQKYLPFVDEKIDLFLANADKYGYKIFIDGSCSPDVIKRLSAKGVSGFVLGTAALFGNGRVYADEIPKLRLL